MRLRCSGVSFCFLLTGALMVVTQPPGADGFCGSAFAVKARRTRSGGIMSAVSRGLERLPSGSESVDPEPKVRVDAMESLRAALKNCMLAGARSGRGLTPSTRDFAPGGTSTKGDRGAGPPDPSLTTTTDSRSSRLPPGLDLPSRNGVDVAVGRAVGEPGPPPAGVVEVRTSVEGFENGSPFNGGTRPTELAAEGVLRGA